MPISEIGTIGGLVEYLVEQGLKVGIAAEIIAKAFGYGVDSARFRLPENLVAPQIKVAPANGQLSLIEEVAPTKLATKKEPKKALHRIPSDFKITPELAAFARDRAFTPLEIETMWTKFFNHYDGNGETAVNWESKWRTWVMRGVEYKNRDNPPRRPDHIDGRL